MTQILVESIFIRAKLKYKTQGHFKVNNLIEHK